MDYLSRASNFVSERILRRRAKDEAAAVEVSKTDAYLNFAFKVLRWEDPKVTWSAFLGTNFLFFLIVYYEIRFYSFVCLSLLALVLMDFHGEVFDIKQPAQVVSYKSIRLSAGNIARNMYTLKRENPSMFCGIMTSVFVLLSFVGRTVSGKLLSYILLVGMFFGPYLISLIPEEHRKKIYNAVSSLKNNEGIVAETELIPFIANKNFGEERDPDLDSLLTDRTQDSITNSLVSGLTSMPSYLEADINADELEEDDLIPNARSLSYSAAEFSSDSDSEHRQMEFEQAHFNGDSSSDDDHEYSKGLKFNDETDATVKTAGVLSAGLLTMGSNLLSNMLQSVTAREPQKPDSDSEFEIIDSDEADES